MINLDRAAVQTAVAIAALSALVTGAITIGFDEVRRLLAEKREREKQ